MCLIALQATRLTPELLVTEHQALLDAVTDGEEARLSALLKAHRADAVARTEAGLARSEEADQAIVVLADSRTPNLPHPWG